MFDEDLDIWEEDLEGLLFRVDRCFTAGQGDV